MLADPDQASFGPQPPPTRVAELGDLGAGLGPKPVPASLRLSRNAAPAGTSVLLNPSALNHKHPGQSVEELLDAAAGDGPGDDQLLDLLGAVEDVEIWHRSACEAINHAHHPGHTRDNSSEPTHHV